MTTDRADQLLKLLEGITAELDGPEASPDRLHEILADLRAIDAERSRTRYSERDPLAFRPPMHVTSA